MPPAAATVSAPAARSRGMQPSRLGLPILLGLSLLAGTVLHSRRSPFWIDEVYSLNLLADGSMGHMNYALAHAADGGLPLYYNLGWLWARVFGTGFLSLRLLSTVCVLGALAIVWRSLGAIYTARARALAVFTVFGASTLLLKAAGEARFYGLFLLTASTVFALLLEADRRQSRALLATLFAANALLVETHVYGLLYSSLMLAGLVAADLWQRRMRPGVYLCVAASWPLILLWLRPLERLAATGKPHGYMPVPTIKDLLGSFNLQVELLVPLLFTVTIAGYLARGAAAAGNAIPASSRRTTAVWIAAALLLMPVFSFVVSHVHTPIFEGRYFLPSVLGLAVLMAELAEITGFATARAPWITALSGLLLVGLGLSPLLYAHQAVVPGWNRDTVDHLLAMHMPVFFEDSHDFYPLEVLAGRDGTQFFYPLDYDDALLPKAYTGAALDYHIGVVLRSLGYEAPNIVDDGALCRARQFLVVDKPDLYWFDRQVRASGNFDTRVLEDFPASDRYNIAAKLVLAAWKPAAYAAHCTMQVR